MLQSFKILTLLALFIINDCYGKIIHHSVDEFGPIWVEDDIYKRCLSFEPITESKVRQTCLIRKDPKRLVFYYQKIILGGLYINNKTPKQVLVLGLGGGTLITALTELLPHAHFDIVEINPSVVKIAKKYFNFKETGNTSLFMQDGYKFVMDAKLSKKKYDFIIVDVFARQYIPSEFLTLDFTQAAKDILSPEGIIAINTFVNHKFSQTKLEDSLYKQVFGKFWDVRSKGNRIIFTSPAAILNRDIVVRNATIWNIEFQKHGVMQKWLLPKILEAKEITN
jgi:spermidine synthase